MDKTERELLEKLLLENTLLKRQVADLKATDGVKEGMPVYCNECSRLYVLDKSDGRIHRIGDDRHDSLWVSDDGVHYHNLQNGDGGTVKDDPECGYVILETMDGCLGSKELARHGFAPDKRFVEQVERYNAEHGN